MNSILGLLVILFVATQSAAQIRLGGDDVGNGGGIAEKNFIIAARNLENYASLCLSTPSCRLDEAERSVLHAIIQSMPRQRQNAHQLQFLSERENPGFFILGGQPKVAKTGSRVGDVIYVNVDLIYSMNGFGHIEALSIPDALAILIHEYGHHVSAASHAELDLLGVKVSLFLRNRIQHTPVLPWNQDISVTTIQSQNIQSFPQVLLNIGEEIWDLTKIVESSVFCPVLNIPIPILPFPDLQLGRERPLGIYLHNLHWESASKESSSGEFVSRANLTHLCPSGTGFLTGVNSFRLQIKFKTEEKPGLKPGLSGRSVSVTQKYEPWYKIIQLPRL